MIIFFGSQLQSATATAILKRRFITVSKHVEGIFKTKKCSPLIIFDAIIFLINEPIFTNLVLFEKYCRALYFDVNFCSDIWRKHEEKWRWKIFVESFNNNLFFLHHYNKAESLLISEMRKLRINIFFAFESDRQHSHDFLRKTLFIFVIHTDDDRRIAVETFVDKNYIYN